MFRRFSRAFWPVCAIALVAVFIWGVARFYHPVYGFTSLIQFDATNVATMVPEARHRPVFVNREAGGYDGVYYAQIATHPSLRDPALAPAMDNLGYRARRIFAEWVAWALALGNPARALDTYALLNPLCWLVLAALLLWIFPPRTAHDFVAWSGLLFSAGVLASVRLALTDLPALVLLTGVMIAVQRGRMNSAVGLLAAAGLTRETSLVVAPALVRGSWPTIALRLALAAVPLAVWLVYIRVVVGPGDNGWSNFDLPGTKYLEKWGAVFASFKNPEVALLSWTTLLALIGLTVQAAWLWVRPQWTSGWWRFGIGYAAMLLLLGTAVWEGFPGAATRVLLPLNLAFNALVPRTRFGLALLIVGNLTVPAGLIQVADRPNDGRELAAARGTDRTLLVQTESNWLPVERDAKQFWAWSHGDATITLRAFPDGATARVEARLRALAPQTIEIKQAGQTLWRGRVGEAWLPASFSAHDGTIELHTDWRRAPGETTALVFCLGRVRLSEIRATPAPSTAPPGR